MSESEENVSDALRALRKAAGLSQPAAAGATGAAVSGSYLGMVETGKRVPSAEAIEALLEAYGRPDEFGRLEGLARLERALRQIPRRAQRAGWDKERAEAEERKIREVWRHGTALPSGEGVVVPLRPHRRSPDDEPEPPGGASAAVEQARFAAKMIWNRGVTPEEREQVLRAFEEAFGDDD